MSFEKTQGQKRFVIKRNTTVGSVFNLMYVYADKVEDLVEQAIEYNRNSGIDSIDIEFVGNNTYRR